MNTARSGNPAGANPLARLPQVDALLQRPDAAAPIAEHGRRALVDALREQLDEARDRIRRGGAVPDAAELVAAAARALAGRRAGALRPVINATGVVLHTNLGRAPLSAAARQAVVDATGYTTLEYDLASGERGSRTAHLGALAAEVTAMPAATVVNNGAAGLVLILAALARDREVVVSRGELIEIGGSYRLPEIMAAAGCRLVEVGTTNRTRIGDYRDAITQTTALLLKVHRSNYRVVGFTAEASASELAALGTETGLPFVYDLGSGLLRDVTDGPLAHEPSVESAVRDGADLVVFSGDKLLGGPQAGIVAGRGDLVSRCTRHPLARALRVDKLQRAALEATFASHLRDPVSHDLPTVAMLTADPDTLHRRATWMAEQLGGGADVRAVDGVAGGGALPGIELPSWAVALHASDAAALAHALRHGDTPVVARVEHDRVLLDLRTIPPSQDAEVVDLVLAAVQ